MATPQEKIITGYQWGEFNQYIGPYEFPSEKEGNDIKLAPRTTLIAPPSDIPEGKEAAWYNNNWIIRDIDPRGQGVFS